MPVFSPNLEKSLHRSLAIANERNRSHANTEHMLLALLDDPDASEMLKTLNIEVSRLRNILVDHLEISEKRVSSTPNEDSKPTLPFQRTVQRAVIAVQSSDREEVDGADLLVAVTSEKTSYAARQLKKLEFDPYLATTYVLRKHRKRNSEQLSPRPVSLPTLTKAVAEASISTPEFLPVKGRLRFSENGAINRITERKAAVKERCTSLLKLASQRSNEQPQLLPLVESYTRALQTLRRDRGAYKLFLAGLEIDLFVRTKTAAIPDNDRNLPLDSDLLQAVRSLMMAHAGLVMLFPDVNQTAGDLDRYARLGESIESFKISLFDPVIDHLARSPEIFDKDTLDLTNKIKQVSDRELEENLPASQATTAVKSSWIRGSLSSIATYLLKSGKSTIKTVKDEALKEGTKAAIRNTDQLSASIMEFLRQARPNLASLSESFPATFGWVKHLIAYLWPF